MLKRVSVNDLFFEVVERPLKAIVDNQIIESKDYFTLNSEGEILGIKPLKPLQKRLFVDNITANDTLLALSIKIYNNSLAPKAYINERRNESFIFMGLSENKTVPKEKPKNNIISKLKEIGFEPTIAVRNGYDYEDKLVYYLLLEQKISNQTYGYLTIARFDIREQLIEQLLQSERSEHFSIIEKELLTTAYNKFMHAYETFFEKYNSLSTIKATPKELIAITLDIYNKNRNIQAIKSDSPLEKSISYIIKTSSEHFFDRNANNLSYILSYIVRYQQINFKLEEISDRYINDALQEKKVYKNIDRLFTAKNSNPTELKIYIDDQVKVLDEVNKVL
jgi:hypothetical protein